MKEFTLSLGVVSVTCHSDESCGRKVHYITTVGKHEFRHHAKTSIGSLQNAYVEIRLLSPEVREVFDNEARQLALTDLAHLLSEFQAYGDATDLARKGRIWTTEFMNDDRYCVSRRLTSTNGDYSRDSFEVTYKVEYDTREIVSKTTGQAAWQLLEPGAATDQTRLLAELALVRKLH